MEMEYVDSKNVDQIGYNEETGECHVIFKSGRHYIYSDVSEEVWSQFRSAESKGKFLNAEFKAKLYPYQEI